MATNLRSSLTFTLDWLYRSIDAASSREITDSNSISVLDVLTNGTIVDTADLKWDDRRTVNDAANDDLDLAGSLLDSFGTTLTFAKIKGIIIQNRNTTAAENLVVGGGSNAFASWLGASDDTITVGPNGLFVLWNPSLAGYAVTAGTGDILRLTGSGGNITYDIVLIGTSA